jgi:hypothetical protein
LTPFLLPACRWTSDSDYPPKLFLFKSIKLFFSIIEIKTIVKIKRWQVFDAVVDSSAFARVNSNSDRCDADHIGLEFYPFHRWRYCQISRTPRPRVCWRNILTLCCLYNHKHYYTYRYNDVRPAGVGHGTGVRKKKQN